MAAIVKPMMDGGDAPWPLYMAGAFFAVLLWMMKISPLAFALGSYLPMGNNTPVLVGGLISYFVSHSSDDAKVNAKRLSEGNTVASGRDVCGHRRLLRALHLPLRDGQARSQAGLNLEHIDV